MKDIILTKNGVELGTVQEFLETLFVMEGDLESYFSYHPPDADRKKIHEQINNFCLEMFGKMSKNSALSDTDFNGYIKTHLELFDQVVQFALNVTDNLCCTQWAIRAMDEMSTEPTSILMQIQQYRMFLNQGVTIDSIKVNLL